MSGVTRREADEYVSLMAVTFAVVAETIRADEETYPEVVLG